MYSHSTCQLTVQMADCSKSKSMVQPGGTERFNKVICAFVTNGVNKRKVQLILDLYFKQRGLTFPRIRFQMQAFQMNHASEFQGNITFIT
jgi:hypothetical protein